MATKYSPEFKSSIIAKMLPPNNVSVPDLAGETQIPKDTLYCWRSKAVKDADGAVLAATAKGVLSSQEKFAVVLETASLNETELSAYCRRKGLYPQEIEAWRASCMAANATVSGKAERAEVRAQKLEIRELEKELRRKERALAEAAALLVLQKKVRALFAEPEDEKSSSKSDER
jgi:transposase-like protein